MNLNDYILPFERVVVFGDIHGAIEPLLSAIKSTDIDNTFYIFLGDLINGDDYSYEVVEVVLDILDSGHGALTIGNHDDKMYRYFNGEVSKLNSKYAKTLYDVKDKETDFKNKLERLCEHEMCDFVHVFGNVVVSHAAIPPSIWEDDLDCVSSKKDVRLAKYGTKKTDMFWVDEVPDKKVAIVGHDRFVFNKNELEPMIIKNENGGTVYFIDTGCGKGKLNVLTSVIFDVSEENYPKLENIKSYAD